MARFALPVAVTGFVTAGVFLVGGVLSAAFLGLPLVFSLLAVTFAFAAACGAYYSVTVA